jgi:hypothetical protein
MYYIDFLAVRVYMFKLDMLKSKRRCDISFKMIVIIRITSPPAKLNCIILN